MKCPKCQRDTYSKKWNACTALGCSLNHSRVVGIPTRNVSRETSREPLHNETTMERVRRRARGWADREEAKRA